MRARELPARPSLAQYKKQAKELVKAYRSGCRRVQSGPRRRSNCATGTAHRSKAALWGATNRPHEADYLLVIETLLAAGAHVDPAVVQWWRQQPAASPEAGARILRSLETRATPS